MTNPLLEEIYEARAQIWKECGETVDGLFNYLRSKRPKYETWPGNRRMSTRTRPPRTSTRKKAARP